MAAARLLDLTRSLRRAGRVATGVDRVEHAYLEYLLADDVPVFGLFRTALGYVLVDPVGLRGFSDRVQGKVPWGPAGILSRLPVGRGSDQRRAESDVRRLSVARAVPSHLKDMLARALPGGYVYFNVGHSNLTDRVLGAVVASGGQIAAMVHDVIPLEYPAFQRAGSVDPFREKLHRIGARARWVIYNSQDTRTRAEGFMRAWGRVPDAIVAHLGTTVPAVDRAQLPDGLPLDAPYFVTVSTIEPRKNHAFLLDLWDDLGPTAPPLFICGSRGWNNDAVFARLDALSDQNRVTELTGLSDPALAALVQGAAGSLFPSLAEGYGFPPLEALALGSRVLCNDLEVLREVLGEKAVYAPVSDRYLWITTIKEWGQNPPDMHKSGQFFGPTWPDHFKTVLRLR